MNEMLMVSGIIIGLWLLILLLRVPASVAFFSLLVGQLLATDASGDVYEFIGGVLNVNDIKIIQITLLILPLALTILFLRGRVKKSQFFIEAIPAFFVAVVAVLLAYPLIPALQTIVDTATQSRSEQYKSLILLAAAVSGLFSTWMNYPKPHDKHKKKH